MREYALYREAACDVQVVQQGDSVPQDYGRLLLRLGVAHPLHAGLAGASPTFENLKRRLTMLQQTESSSRLRGALLVALIAVVGVIPYRVTAKGDAGNAKTSKTQLTYISTHSSHPGISPSSGFAWADKGRVIFEGMDVDPTFVRSQIQDNTSVLLFRQGDQTYVVHDPETMKKVGHAIAPLTATLADQQDLLKQRQQLTERRMALSENGRPYPASGCRSRPSTGLVTPNARTTSTQWTSLWPRRARTRHPSKKKRTPTASSKPPSRSGKRGPTARCSRPSMPWDVRRSLQARRRRSPCRP